MAFSKVDFFSEALKRIVTFHIFLPNDTQEEFITGNSNYERETRVLYLLHGFSGNTLDWVTGSNVMELSRMYNVAVIMPSGENSFYLDRKGTGNLYETYIAEELPAYIKKTFHLSHNRENVWIGGLSMGGYGALRLGLKYCEQYGAVFGLSSALIIRDLSEMSKENPLVQSMADYDYYLQIFGSPEDILTRDVNPEWLVKRNQRENRKFPRIFMACGTEDILIKQNRQFRDFLQEQNVAVTYHESRGIHNWKFWNEYLEPAVQWALNG